MKFWSNTLFIVSLGIALKTTASFAMENPNEQELAWKRSLAEYYRTSLNREADADGMAHYLLQAQSGRNLEEIRIEIADSPEARAKKAVAQNADEALIELNDAFSGVTISKNGVKETRLDGFTVVSSVQDSHGNIWLATDKYGIFVYGKDLASRGRFGDENWAKTTRWFANEYVNAMTKDKDGNIWIALEAGTYIGIGGLVRFTPNSDGDPKMGSWRLFTKQDGVLRSNHVRGFEIEESGNISVRTAKDGDEAKSDLTNLSQFK